MKWLRTQTNQPEESLVNLEHVVAVYSRGGQVKADTTSGTLMLTYFEGPDAERLATRCVLALWRELQAGVVNIDMANVAEDALEEVS